VFGGGGDSWRARVVVRCDAFAGRRVARAEEQQRENMMEQQQSYAERLLKASQVNSKVAGSSRVMVLLMEVPFCFVGKVGRYRTYMYAVLYEIVEKSRGGDG